MAICFSTSPLSPGQQSRSFVLPAANIGGDGGSRAFVISCVRDMGASDANSPAVVRVVQGSNTLLSETFTGNSSDATFISSPADGALYVANDGPAALVSVSIQPAIGGL
jgi:hypothetical protein